MTLPMPDPSSAKHRTLPKPNAIRQNLTDGTSTSKDSSPWQHRLVSHNLSQKLPESDLGRRNTVPSISYYERRSSDVNGGQTPMIDSTSNDSASLPSIALGPLTRKRGAPAMADEARSGSKSPSSPVASEGAREFCLCQPDPKIPRPRNAFILYRQHQQAAVVAQYPGLPNPEISKIIGEQWQSLGADSKNEWKALAEEEKARHQQQYPDYRYQPRRNGRHSNASSVSGASGAPSAISEQSTCLKCLGKKMNPPNTPFTPHVPSNAGGPPPGMVTMHPSRRTYTTTAGPQPNRPQMMGAMASPGSGRVRPYVEAFGQPPQQDLRLRYAGQPPPSAPLSPESHKRRRFHGHGVLVPARGEFYPQQGQQYSAMERPMARPEMMQGPRVAMGPPRRSTYQQSSIPQMQQMQQIRSQFAQQPRDPSLVLPPLKTVTGSGPPSQLRKPGVDAMIKSLSVMNKLKFFDQISHPLSAPSTASPPFETQGAIVAIEGLSADSVWNLTNSLAEQLEKDGKFAVKIFDGPNPYKFNGDSYTRGSNSSTDSQPLTVESFLAIIGEWHRISREMTEYITTKPTAIRFNTTVLDRQDTHMSDAPREQPPDTAVSPRTLRKAADLSLVSPMPHLSGPASSSTNSKQPAERTSPPRRTPPTPPPPPPPPPPTAAPPKASLPSPPNSSANSSPSLIPIALIPHYQLTTVDIGSMSVPILDNYSPHSHWQWLASLYRGCVGADVTVVVEDIHDAAVAAAGSGAGFGAHPSHSNSNSGSGNGNNSRSSISGNGGEAQGLQEGVEVRLQDARAIIVRFGLEGMALAGEGWEKAKRRVGFEVEEFLRAGR